MTAAFNWQSLPAFLAMLLFWVLAAYLITRSPRGLVPSIAVAAQVSAALYLLGQGMSMNAQTFEQWLPWSRNLLWAAHLAPTFWYWITLLVLREQAAIPVATRFLRFFAYPLGVAFALASVCFATSIYLGDTLHIWSAVELLPPDRAGSSRFWLPAGPLYVPFTLFVAASTVAAALNVWVAWRTAADPERRRCLAWLFVAGLLFVGGANSLALLSWMLDGAIPVWVGDAMLAGAMVAMAWNLAAYSLLVRGQVIRTDFLYFVSALLVVAVVYVLAVLLVRPRPDFEVVQLLAIMGPLVILTHALVDVLRRILDRAFFAEDVQQLRSTLGSVAQAAAMEADLPALLNEAQEEIARVSSQHLLRLTELALRRLNSPALLAECELAERVPSVVAAACEQLGLPATAASNPVDRAHALREVLRSGIERLKPADAEVDSTPGALQYHILREEYIQGMLNKHIMARHALSEGSFHRNRRQAISMLSRELETQERRLGAG